MGVKGEPCPPGYKRTEVGVIPADWEVSELRSLKPFVTSGSRGWAAFYSEFGAPFIRITNLTRAHIYLDFENLKRVALPENTREARRAQAIDNDVLISITADIGIIGYITERLNQPAYINQHIALLRFPLSLVSSRFIAYFLASERLRKHFQALTDSGAKAGMNLSTVQQVHVALPSSYREQQAIADALTNTDTLIESLEQLLTKKRRIKQGAMQELLTGRKRLPGFSGQWKLKYLADIAEIDSESLGASTKDYYRFNYIALDDVAQGSLESYSQQTHSSAPLRARRRLRKNDLLFSTVRPKLMSHLYFSLDGEWVCSTGFSVIRCKKGLAYPAYVFFHLFGRNVIRQVSRVLSGSGYPAISSRDVRTLEIPIPEYDEQKAIATILTDMDNEITTLEAKLHKARQIKQGMMQELLTGRIRLV